MTARARREAGRKVLRLSARTRALRHSGWRSLVTRILVVNLLALITFAGGVLYIDNFRSRMLETRSVELLRQGEIIADLIAADGGADTRLVENFSMRRGTRVRLYATDGTRMADNWSNPATARFMLEDPTTAGFRRQSAIAIDRLIDFLTGQGDLPPLQELGVDKRSSWPEAEQAATTGEARIAARQTADRLVVLQAAVPLPDSSRVDGPHKVLLLTIDTPDVVDLVRRERATSFNVFLIVLGFSLALSIYLARTVVVPLRQLASSAHRVRLGRSREVEIHRLPQRRDEIGSLARALADMTAALRQRIDATEAFAADVAHELKNPLASLRSAVETLGRVRDDGARTQLLAVIDEDVRRIDRLISDISAASRLDAELSRASLQPVDVGKLIRNITSGLVAANRIPSHIRLEVMTPSTAKPAMVAGDADRLAQVFNNLLDNAMSFSPSGGTITLSVVKTSQGTVELSVEDDGPGVPHEARGSIFERFYSERPSAEDYGRHSGLGLSIAHAIIDAMEGDILVTDRRDGKEGARFVVVLPAL